ncbi:MAG: putative Ig domain-containing protein, partial [Chloroflexota bacterium]|nr:putative Ig domain-containing protein [Chloroflexota bacterium]
MCNTIAQITPDVPLAPVPGAPPGTYMPDFGALPGTVYQMPPFPGNPPWKMVYVPAARINPGTGQPQFTTVTLDLAALGVSGTGKIQFRFDTVDNFGNGYKGWIVDSVLVKGPTTVGSTAVVDRETFTWSASFTLAQGENAITATVTRSAYAPPLVATDSVSAFLDTVAPIVTIIAGATPTNVSARTIQIQYTSATPDSLEVTQTTSLGTRTVLIKRTGFSPPTETLSVPLSLDEGTNTFNATMTNQAALSANAAPKVVILDTAQPVLTTLATMYPVGEFSARAGDEAIFQANASDPGSGILKVEFIMPGGSVPAGMMLTAADIPAAVRDKWGTTAGYLLPFELPSSAASGTYTVTLKATDNAGNTKTATVNATVVATLQAFNLYLMPGRNLVSLPLQPTSGTDFDIATLLNQLAPNSNLGAGAKLSDVIDTISYFTGGTAATGTWLMYSTGPAADTLTTVTTGLAYWIKMKDGVFKLSDPLAPGLPQTAAPIKLTIVGQFLNSEDVPPTYDVVKDWNMRGLHAEYPRLVDSQFLRGVSSGVAVP